MTTTRCHVYQMGDLFKGYITIDAEQTILKQEEIVPVYVVPIKKINEYDVYVRISKITGTILHIFWESPQCFTEQVAVKICKKIISHLYKP